MADGAGTVAVLGGLVMILTAGIPVLFMSKDEKKDDAATRMATLEQSLTSELGEEELAAMMMEEVEEVEVGTAGTAIMEDMEQVESADGPPYDGSKFRGTI